MSDSLEFDEFSAANHVSVKISESASKTSEEDLTENVDKDLLIQDAKEFDDKSDGNKEKIEENIKIVTNLVNDFNLKHQLGQINAISWKTTSLFQIEVILILVIFLRY